MKGSVVARDDLELLFNTLVQLGKIISQQTQQSPDVASATLLQYSALTFIKEVPDKTVSEFATHLVLSKSSATQLTERLLKAGFVTKITDSDDKRITRLRVTSQGEEQIKILRGQVMKNMEDIFSNVPAKDIKELIRIHTNLAEALKETK